MSARPGKSLAASSLVTLVLAGSALANERHFGYVYETGVLAPGAREIEGSNTIRFGRDQFYSALDHRLEFETGVAENLMASLYLNWSNVTSGDSALSSSFEWQGFSSEWKWKLADPVANPVGLALYAELTYATTGFELEPKVLLDKRIGNWTLAANFITEFEFENGSDEAELEEIAPGAALGATYDFGKGFHAGLELMNHNAIAKQASGDMKFSFASIYAGPALSYATESWWVSLSLLPQLPALYKADGGSILVLDDGEKFNARLLFSFHI